MSGGLLSYLCQYQGGLLSGGLLSGGGGCLCPAAYVLLPFVIGYMMNTYLFAYLAFGNVCSIDDCIACITIICYCVVLCCVVLCLINHKYLDRNYNTVRRSMPRKK